MLASCRGLTILHSISPRESDMDKPPVGVMPERLWLETRFNDLAEACNRYVEARKPIPSEWRDEMIRHGRRLRSMPGVREWMRFFGCMNW